MPIAADGLLAVDEPIGEVKPVEPSKTEEKPGEKVETTKKPEEVLAEYKTLIETQGQKLEKLEKILSAYDEERKRREAEERLRYITQPEKEPEGKTEVVQPGPDDFDWGNPLKSIEARARKVAQEELEKEKKAKEKYDKQMYFETGKKNFFSTKDRVYRQNPELFAGIETDVENVLTQGFQTGAINADALGQDKTWETAAAMIAYEKGDIDRLAKIKRPKIEAMKDTGTGAIPSQVREQTKSTTTPNIELDDLAKEYMKQRNITYEQAIELIKYARDNSYQMTDRTVIGSR